MVKSRFGIRTLLAFTPFLFFLSLTVLGFVVKKEKGPQDNMMWLMVFAAIITAVVTFYYMRVMIVTPDEIIIKTIYQRKRISKEDILRINLYAYSRGFLCIQIKYKDDKKVNIFDTYYSNIHSIKQVLQDHYSTTIKPFAIDELYMRGIKRVSPIPPGVKMKIAGNHFTSMKGIFFYVLIIPLIFALLIGQAQTTGGYIFISLFIAFFYWLFGHQLHYFKLTSQELIIRNHVMPWVKRRYLLNEIVLINCESPNNRSDAIRIITHNKQSRAYSAGSLRDKHWRKLLNNLRALGIRINKQFLYSY
jgi:hypothetical protein